MSADLYVGVMTTTKDRIIDEFVSALSVVADEVQEKLDAKDRRITELEDALSKLMAMVPVQYRDHPAYANAAELVRLNGGRG